MNYSLVIAIVLIILLIAYFSNSQPAEGMDEGCKNGICITKPKKLKQD